MATRRARWAASLLLALGLPALALAQAQDVVWKTVARSSPSSPTVVASTNAHTPSAAPAAIIGRPVPIATTNRLNAALAPVPTNPRASLVGGRPVPIARAQADDPDPPAPWPPPPPPPSVIDDLRPVSARRNVGRPALPEREEALTKHEVWQPADPPPPELSGVETGQRVGPGWGEKFMGWFEWSDGGSCSGRTGVQSDHCFEGLISPVTAPFFFEDPRALTEIRPIFMYQKAPSDNAFRGGNAFFFGTQARLALSERFSIVLHELGFLSLNPNSPSPRFQDETGFAEVKLGAKYTFLRNAEAGSAAAVGLMLEIPAGSSKVFQNVGDLGITPYLSYGQSLWRTSYGSLGLMGNMGYSFSTDNLRSEFFYTNFHLDYNVANLNKIFPLFEVNWIYYTKSGNNVNLGAEGADLINFGSTTTAGKNYVSLAFGARYKFCESIIAGAALQFPVSNEKGLQDYRLTFDLIFRY